MTAYIPPLPPPNPSIMGPGKLPPRLSAQLQEIYRAYSNPPPDFGQQYIFGTPKDVPPTTPYQRYLWDLYGPPGRDWFPLWNYGLLLVSMAALGLLVTHWLGLWG